MALNATQRNALEGILKFHFNKIKEFTFEDQITFQNGINDESALKALQLILEDNITPSQWAKLKEWGVWDGAVKKFRRILNHPAPQNRNRHFSRVQDDQDGLLGLTAQNDDTSEAVIKEDVVQYITQEVTRRVEAMQSQGIKPFIIQEILELNTQVITKEDMALYATQEAMTRVGDMLYKNDTIATVRDWQREVYTLQSKGIQHNNDDIIQKLKGKIENAMQYYAITIITQEVKRRVEAMQSQGIRSAVIEKILEFNTEMLTEEGAVRYFNQEMRVITEIIISRDVQLLMNYNQVTLKQVKQLYEQSPKKLAAMAELNVCKLISKNQDAFNDASALFDQSPEELAAIAEQSGIRELMSYTQVTLKQVKQLYEQFPEKLAAIVNVRLLMEYGTVTFEELSELYDKFPKKFAAIAELSVIYLMIKNRVTLEEVIELYERDPKELAAIAESDVRKLMSENRVTLKEVIELYKQNPKKTCSNS